MPRYFFHTGIGADRVTDPEGVELRDPDEAWERARATALGLMGGDRADQSRLMSASLVVTGEAGEVVLEFPFAEAVTLPPVEDGTRHWRALRRSGRRFGARERVETRAWSRSRWQRDRERLQVAPGRDSARRIRPAMPRQNGRAAPSLERRVLRNIDHERQTPTMSRNRLRRSFTVETKARGRQAPAILPVRAPLLDQPSPAFPSLEAAALFSREPVRPADAGAEAAGRSATRRILPSLIEAPAPEPEPAVIEPVVREPRVRRVKLARAEPLPAGLVQPVAAPTDPSPGKPVPAVPVEPARRAGRRAEKALPLGERWKRRLPRVCW